MLLHRLAVYTISDFFVLDICEILVGDDWLLLQTLHQFQLYAARIYTLALAAVVNQVLCLKATAVRRLIAVYAMTAIARALVLQLDESFN